MPIVSPNDPLFSTVPKEVLIRLPDIDEIYADAGNTAILGALDGLYAQRAAEIWQQSSQIGLGGILQSVGMPLLGMFNKTADLMHVNVVDEVRDGLRSVYGTLRDARNEMATSPADGGDALGMSVGLAAGVAVDVASVVPVLGWVVQGVWAVAKLIVRISKIVKANKQEAKVIYSPTSFNPEVDNGVVNLSLDSMRGSRDWSLLFSPPSLEKGVGTLPDFLAYELKDGWEIRRKDPNSLPEAPGLGYANAGWTGMVPGTGWLHQGIQWRSHGQTQGQMQDTGAILLPSTRNMCIWLWKHIMGAHGEVTPSLYCIDPDIGTYWRGYIFDLHKYLYEDAGFLPAADRVAIIKTLDRDIDGRKIFGWGKKLKPSEAEVDKYQPVQECYALRARQLAYMDTLMCAYVDDTFVALQKSATLRDRHEQRRKQLLHHPARCQVDISSVPDKEYRDALLASGVGAGPCMTVGLDLASPDFAAPKDVPDGQSGAAGLPGPGTLLGGDPLDLPPSPWPWVVAGLSVIALGATAAAHWDEIRRFRRRARRLAR